MVLYLIGLGLGDEKDVTIKGFEAIQKCEKVYLEYYTSILGVGKEKLEASFKKELIEADRDFVEQGFEKVLDEMASSPVEKHYALLVVGDVFCATTHSDIFLRAIKRGIKVEAIHNASIVNAVGCTGLQVYRFGEIVTLPFFTEKWRPYSFYDKIAANLKNNLHTLVLVDIKVKERSVENLLKNKPIFEPPRFMTIKTAVEQLLEAEEKVGKGAYSKDTKCFGLARVGQPTQKIVGARMADFLDEEKIDMGPPLHSFIICGELQCLEEDCYQHFSSENQKPKTEKPVEEKKVDQ